MLRIYEKDLTADQLSTALATNGLGPLNCAQAARCHRMINGDWSLSLTYPLDAPGADLLLPERLICYEDDVTGEEQLYRISRRTPRTTRQGRVIDIEAPHVVYDLRHKFITNIETTEDDRYPDGIDAETALTQLLDGTGFAVGEVSVDLSRLDYLNVLQKDVMSCIKEQLLDKWGGELIFDNFTVHLVAAMGQDRRYPIRDGRNIEAITITENYDKVVTRLHVRGYDGANFEEINDGCDFIDSKLIGQYSHIREGYADFSDEDDPQALMDLGLAELARRELPEITYDIRLAQMQGSVQYAAYKRLEVCGLGDTAVLSTQALSKPVILRCSELETDCLTGRNLTVKLGNADQELLASITSGTSAADRLAHVLDSQGNLQAEKITGKLNLVRIKNLEVEIARIASATLKDAKIDVAQIQNLSAEVAKIIVASIGEMHVDWAQIESLTAAMSELIKAKIGEADIDFAHIKDLITDASIITKGEAGKLYIADLAVTEANMVSLSVGELLVRGQDGAFYAVSVGEDGQIVTERKEVTGSDIADKTINGGEKIIEGSITAGTLNVQEIFADSEIVRELIAANISVDTLFARDAVLHAMEAMDIRGNEYLKLTVTDIRKEVSTLVGYRVEVVSTSDVLSEDIQQTTLAARVWHGSQDVTAEFPAERFAWQRVTADATADEMWNAAHKGMKAVTVTTRDVWYSATYSCILMDAV